MWLNRRLSDGCRSGNARGKIGAEQPPRTVVRGLGISSGPDWRCALPRTLILFPSSAAGASAAAAAAAVACAAGFDDSAAAQSDDSALLVVLAASAESAALAALTDSVVSADTLKYAAVAVAVAVAAPLSLQSQERQQSWRFRVV